MATDITPRDALEPFPGQRFPWQSPPNHPPGSVVVGWCAIGRWPWSHLIMECGDGKPFFLCRGWGSFYFGKMDPDPKRKCSLCREWEERMRAGNVRLAAESDAATD